MDRRLILDERTLELARELIECKREYATVTNAKWYQFRKRFRRDYKKRSLVQKSLAVSGELAARYEGLMFQMYRRSTSGDEGLTSAAWELVQFDVLELLRNTARTMTDHRNFSRALWNICRGRLGTNERVLALKPKFMLRQFVDEMPSSDERGFLRTMAYGQHDDPGYSRREILNLRDRSLPALHKHVLSHAADVSVLTDGEITEDMVNGFTAPFAEYRRWVFEA